LMRSLGSGVREFKKGAKGEVEDDAKSVKPADSGKGAEEEKP
jgi:Sec-independent protein translocase protein TatA